MKELVWVFFGLFLGFLAGSAYTIHLQETEKIANNVNVVVELTEGTYENYNFN